MARCHLRVTLRDGSGSSIQNARALLYLHGSTTLVTDAWDTETGGRLVSSILTNSEGEIECWLDGAKLVDVSITDNSGAAYLAGVPATTLSWTTFIEVIEVYPSPSELVTTSSLATASVVHLANSETIIGDKSFHGAVTFGQGKPWVDPYAYGAFGDGSVHSASEHGYASLSQLQADFPFAISLTDNFEYLCWQKCLNVATATPTGQTAATKTPVASVNGLSGVFNIGQNTLLVRGVQGFKMFGAGTSVCEIRGNKPNNPILELDGVADGTFRDFTIGNVDAANIPSAGIKLWWNQAGGTVRSSSNNTFERIKIGGYLVRGVFTDGHNQVDNTTWIACLANLNWTNGTTTHSQAGFQFGDGVPANNVTHHLYHCGVTNCLYGLYAYGSHFSCWGLEGGVNGTDCYISSATVPQLIDSLRSEGSIRAIVKSGGSAASMLSVSNVVFSSANLASDGIWIDVVHSGNVNINNVSNQYAPPGVTPNIRLVTTAGAANPVNAIASNVISQSTIDNAFNTAVGSNVTVLNYTQMNSSGQPILMTPRRTIVDGTIVETVKGTGDPGSFGIAHSAGKVGFYGVTPVTRRSLAVAASDPTSTQTLANSLRQALIDLGLGL